MVISWREVYNSNFHEKIEMKLEKEKIWKSNLKNERNGRKKVVSVSFMEVLKIDRVIGNFMV